MVDRSHTGLSLWDAALDTDINMFVFLYKSISCKGFNYNPEFLNVALGSESMVFDRALTELSQRSSRKRQLKRGEGGVYISMLSNLVYA